MALAVTDTSVEPVYTGGTFETLIAGEAITAGQVVYLKASDNRAYKSDANDSTKNTVKGIATNNAAAAQPVYVQTGGNVDVGGTLTVGGIYCLSNTAGGIDAFASLSSSDWIVILGYATAADNLRLMITHTGVQKP